MIKEVSYTPKTIAEDLTLQFTIPLYQRLFAWSPKEVNTLLLNLKEHFDPKPSESDPKPYYIGMLTAIVNGSRIDLIDGQQRFTVMMLLSIVLRDYYGDWKEFSNKDRLKLVARPEDENYLKALIDPAHYKSVYVNVQMDNALACIRNFMATLEDDNARSRYAENVYNHLTFFVSKLPDGYMKDSASLNKYFEVMNSTGKGLEQHEILKVNLIRNHSNSERLLRIWNAVSQMEKPIIFRQEDDTDGLYAQKYCEALADCKKGNFDNALNRIQTYAADSNEKAMTIDVIKMQKASEQKVDSRFEKEEGILSFPEFLLLTLDMTFSCDGKDSFYQKDKLLEKFKIFSEKNIDIDTFYNNLLFYRLVLDYYVVRKDVSNGQSRFFVNYRDRDENPDNREYRKCLRQYMSMLSVSTEFYTWLKPYMSYILVHDDVSASSLLKFLKGFDDERHHKDGYPEKLRTLMYPQIDRYWFWRLDYYLWESRNDEYIFVNDDDRRVVNDYVFRTNRSIEHLHPQDESYNEEWSESITNSFGNLAMISQSFNSLQSNDNIRVKFARIQEQLDNKSLQSIKMLLMFRLANEDHSKWNEELATKHLSQMCDILDKSFIR